MSCLFKSITLSLVTNTLNTSIFNIDAEMEIQIALSFIILMFASKSGFFPLLSSISSLIFAENVLKSIMFFCISSFVELINKFESLLEFITTTLVVSLGAIALVIVLPDLH